MSRTNGYGGSRANLAWIAVDWGTSNLRVWLLGEDGDILDRRTSDAGMAALKPDAFEAALLALVEDALPRRGTLPVVCCGMAGARQGWAEAAYLSVPAAPPDLTHATTVATADDRLDVRLLPGLKQARPADVMRGEETQIGGVLTAEPGFDGVVCLPGTHSKWAQVSAGEVVSFRTFMTGELFALLTGHSVLRHTIGATGWDDGAFEVALSEGLSHPARLTGGLFGLRAEALLNDLAPETARARLSGLLIGMELAGARPYWLGQAVTIVGEGTLARRYGKALEAQGIVPKMLDAEAVTLGGLARARLAATERTA
ncbi:MAG: 2-dehydro-3-deoxygalactonokinase [Pseudomonadota bacterium]